MNPENVINNLIEKIMNTHKVSKNKAVSLLLDALTYNVVISEIVDEIGWILKNNLATEYEGGK